MTQPALIVGAGLAGLIAAHAWPRAPICEASPEPTASHRALLRFRSEAVARITGIEFTKVRVHKGIWYDGAFVPPSINVANLYTQKVTAHLSGDRSIWNIDPVDRYVAPEDFYDQLLRNVRGRVQWGVQVDLRADGMLSGTPLVSTMPLGVAAKQLGLLPQDAIFPRAPITVLRNRINNARVYQTVYFPEPETRLYRASMTGDMLICEFMSPIPEVSSPQGWLDAEMERAIPLLACAFGLAPVWLESDKCWQRSEQKYGKIAPMDDTLRRTLLFTMTQRHNVYSLGRFATWRNILLDDVVQDIDVIKRLMRNADAYALHRAA